MKHLLREVSVSKLSIFDKECSKAQRLSASVCVCICACYRTLCAITKPQEIAVVRCRMMEIVLGKVYNTFTISLSRPTSTPATCHSMSLSRYFCCILIREVHDFKFKQHFTRVRSCSIESENGTEENIRSFWMAQA